MPRTIPRVSDVGARHAMGRLAVERLRAPHAWTPHEKPHARESASAVPQAARTLPNESDEDARAGSAKYQARETITSRIYSSMRSPSRFSISTGVEPFTQSMGLATPRLPSRECEVAIRPPSAWRYRHRCPQMPHSGMTSCVNRPGLPAN